MGRKKILVGGWGGGGVNLLKFCLVGESLPNFFLLWVILPKASSLRGLRVQKCFIFDVFRTMCIMKKF